MKLTLLLLITTTTVLMAQHHPLEIEYDFRRDTLTGNKAVLNKKKLQTEKTFWVREKEGVEFTISNINLLNYNVTINNSREDIINIENNVNQLLFSNSLNSVEAISTQFLTEIHQAYGLSNSLNKHKMRSRSAITPLEGKEETELISTINAKVDNIEKMTDLLKSNMEELSKDTEWLNQGVLYYNVLLTLVQSENPIELILIKRDSITLKFYKQRLKSNGEAFRECIAKTDLLSRRLRTMLSVNSQYEQARVIQREINSVERLLKDNKEKTIVSTLLTENLFTTKETVTELQERFRAVLTILTSDKIENFANEVQRIYSTFDNNNHEVHVKDYKLENVDIVNLDVLVEPKNQKLSYNSRREKFTAVIRTYGGIRFDVSAGLVFNYGLNNQTFYYDSTGLNSDSVRIVKEVERNSYIPFFGSQLNIYINKPWKAAISPGFTFGVSTNLTLVRYYTGLCLVMGNKDRIVLSTGAAFGQVNVLSGKFERDNIYKRSELPEIPPLVSAFRVGGYLSLTYNLSSTKAKNFGSSLIKD